MRGDKEKIIGNKVTEFFFVLYPYLYCFILEPLFHTLVVTACSKTHTYKGDMMEQEYQIYDLLSQKMVKYWV